MRWCAAFGGLLLAAGAALRAQAGDAKDAPGTQQAPPSGYPIPAAPPLSPSQALAQLVIAPGLRVELAAAEPDVVAPVAMQFDAAGRLWVVEMRAYMPDVDGNGERAPSGAIVVLHDRDGDGRFEQRIEFLSGLVLPRAVCPLVTTAGPVRALVIEPPNLYLCTDRDGDLRADDKQVIDAGFGGIDSPEHAANGLLWGLDNRIYLARHDACYRLVGERVVREPSVALGQWGISHDDLGRLFYDDNSTYLRADTLPRQLTLANPRHGRARGLDVLPHRDQSVWPLRVTPGVNRGYQQGVLRDGKLTKFTAACSPYVYRGTLLEAHRGDVFVCEPSANVVRCAELRDVEGELVAKPRYADREWLGSHDERFRPVAITAGPDGALYVADMARGVIQHRLFVTSFLRKQIEARGLAAPLDQGRIWRVVPEGVVRPSSPRLLGLTPAALVERLLDPSGEVRDLAQRELVLAGDLRALAPLRALLRGGQGLARLHTLWSLAGLDGLDAADLAVALRAAEPAVRAAAYELTDRELTVRPNTILAHALLAAAASERDRRAARVLALVLGRVVHDGAIPALVKLLLRYPADETLGSGALAGLAERELVFVQALLATAPSPPAPAVRVALSSAAAALVRGKRSDDLLGLLRLLAPPTTDGHAAELLRGLELAVPKDRDKRPRAGSLGAADEVRACAQSLTPLASLRQRWAALAPAFSAPADVAAVELTPAQQVAWTRGREVFAICAGCHGKNGEGSGEAPLLLGSEWVSGRADVLARIVMHGLEGAIEVDGQRWDKAMPKVALDDVDLAAVVTYVRVTFGQTAPVDVEFVRALREATAGRDRPYAASDLR